MSSPPEHLVSTADRQSGRTRFRGPLIAAALTASLLLPFLHKAYHMDDTLFLAVARQVQHEPLDPFGFEYNWYLAPEPMAVVTQNPPLGGYLLAAVQSVAGPGEIPAHLCFLLIAAGCAVLVHNIAARMCRHPTLVTVLTIATPGFVTSATNVMADVPLLFFWLLAIWITLNAAQYNRPGLLWIAGAAVSAAAMTKYFGIAAAPLLGLYWLLATRKSVWSLLGFLLPVLVLAAWGSFTQLQYGVFHPLAAAGLSVEAKTLTDHAQQAAGTVVFLGGMAVWPVVLLFTLGRLPPILRGTLYVVLSLILLDGWFQWGALGDWARFRTSTTVLFALMIVAGTFLCAGALAGWRNRPDASSTLLGLWLFGTLAFSAFFNWTANIRILLPALPAAALLLVRWVEELPNNRRILVGLKCACLPALAVALAVAWADAQTAAAGRTFARSTLRQLIRDHGPVYFAGHLGFQYYAEAERARPLNLTRPQLPPGALVVFPTNNLQAFASGIFTQPLDRQAVPSTTGLHTDSSRAQAGFYSLLTGPVPYNFASDVPLRTYSIERVVRIEPPPKNFPQNAQPGGI